MLKGLHGPEVERRLPALAATPMAMRPKAAWLSAVTFPEAARATDEVRIGDDEVEGLPGFDLLLCSRIELPPGPTVNPVRRFEPGDDS